MSTSWEIVSIDHGMTECRSGIEKNSLFVDETDKAAPRAGPEEHGRVLCQLSFVKYYTASHTELSEFQSSASLHLGWNVMTHKTKICSLTCELSK